jgi:4-amino-4-deoxy-L-arabinose transferase-like glycosyltransferase/membrane-associated phospholipid phosphatase
MNWLQTLDAGLFHWINHAWCNPWLDVLMPFFSGNHFFGPTAFVLAILVIWKGGVRGRIFVIVLILTVALGDTVVCGTLKEAIGRPRPFLALPDVHIPPGIGRTDSGSMPSSHAANWFAATMVAFIYYRRSVWFMPPLALIVSFSRIYNGVHYPGDVLAGAILGAGYAACGVWTLDRLWRWAGERWLPLWWRRLPSLMNPVVVPAPAGEAAAPELVNQHWLRLGYALIGVQLIVNLAYIASGIITLSGDEAYQWIWSKHLAISYYSKPPLIALTQFLGTHLWGDTAFGVRFFSPIIGAFTALIVLRFVAKVANARAAFWLSIMLPAIPLLSVGSVLMTVDPLSVMFWTLAMIAGWAAIQQTGARRDWLWVGLWMGLGFLSKYTALFQLLSWAIVFWLIPSARTHLRRPGPYLALLVNVLCSFPVLIWNQENGWITLHHVSEGGRFDQPWAFTLANLWDGFTRYTTEFAGVETLLQNPFFFLPVVWAVVFFWQRPFKRALLVYFFCMGAPIFVIYFLLTFHSRVLPNWIAPSILPFFCLGVVYWEERWREGFRPIAAWLTSGLIFGLAIVIILHDTNMVPKLTGGWRIPANLDSTNRVKGWKEAAQLVEAARKKLAQEGKPVFIIGSHYGITGEITFHLPDARAGLPDHPLVYYQSSKIPENQFFFWPGYENRKGENAIYIQEVELLGTNTLPAPLELRQEFESLTEAGCVTARVDGRPMHRIQIVECRGLR